MLESFNHWSKLIFVYDELIIAYTGTGAMGDCVNINECSPMVKKVKQDTTVTAMPCVQILQEALTVNVAQVTVEMESSAQVYTALTMHIWTY